jgi:hypothetical protein
VAKATGKQSVKRARKPGRPTLYSPELAESICNRIACGKSLVSVCKALRLDYSTVAKWLCMPENEEFRAMYTFAHKLQAGYLAGEMKDIADKTRDPQKARLQVDTRKWLAAKYDPKKYGDHVDVELSGSTSHDVWVRLLTEQVAAGRDGDAGDDR